MGFRAGPFVLCKDGCCHQRRRNTNFGPENCFSLKKFPPHMCSQNDQCDVGIILSHVCWGRTPPPPARQVGQPQPKPPSRHGDQGGGGGGWANGLPCHPPPPPQSNFLPAQCESLPQQMTVLHKPPGLCTTHCSTALSFIWGLLCPRMGTQAPVPLPLQPGGQGCIRREGASEAAPEAVRQAVGVGGGYYRLQMPFRLARAVRQTVAGHRLGALEGGGGDTLPMHPCRGGGGFLVPRT